jgi:predicted metalloprotease with PDZ domain
MNRNIVAKVVLVSAGMGVALSLAAGFYAASSGRPVDLCYTVRVAPGEDFQVTLEARGLSKRRPRFRLLKGWGVLQSQDRHVQDLAARDVLGTPLPIQRADRDGVAIWELRQRGEDGIVLNYRVRPYASDLSAEASFADRRHFVILGYSLFLMPEELRQFQPVSIRVRVQGPENWPTWSSWPPRGESVWGPPTPHDLWSGVITGGRYRDSHLSAGSVSVTVLTESRIPGVLGLTMANRLLPVLREMHDLFGSSPRGDSLRVLALYRTQPSRKGRSVMSGNSEEGAFLCLATPDRFRDADDITVLAAHECLHFYLGGAITASPEPPFRNTPSLIWLLEGVTEYLSFKLMNQAGILSGRELAEVVARKDRDYRQTEGWDRLTLADAARRMEDLEVYSLVYTRGFLVGYLLDREMTRRAGPGAFERALRTLFENHNFYRQGTVVTPDDVRAVFEACSPGAGDLIARFADGNAELPGLRSETAAAVPVQ